MTAPAGWSRSRTGTATRRPSSRDGSGDPTAIVAPFGQRTTLTLNADGYLASITNPAGEAHQAAYTVDGLLSTFTDPRGNSSVMTYDTLGRLIRDENAAGGFWTLSRTEQANGYTVTVTSALNRTVVYKAENLAHGRSTASDDRRRRDIHGNADQDRREPAHHVPERHGGRRRAWAPIRVGECKRPCSTSLHAHHARRAWSRRSRAAAPPRSRLQPTRSACKR